MRRLQDLVSPLEVAVRLLSGRESDCILRLLAIAQEAAGVSVLVGSGDLSSDVERRQLAISIYTVLPERFYGLLLRRLVH